MGGDSIVELPEVPMSGVLPVDPPLLLSLLGKTVIIGAFLFLFIAVTIAVLLI